MANEKISNLPAASVIAGANLIPSTQNFTTPGTGVTRKMTLAQAATGVMGVYNVMAYGATGDGVTDDAQAFQNALDAVPSTGGVVFIPSAASGTYRIGRTLRHKSYTCIIGSGPSSTLRALPTFVDSADYLGSAIFLNKNSESAETSFSGYRDFNIYFDNVWTDNTDRPANAGHGIANRAVQGLRISRCGFIAGNDGTATVTCDDVLVQGCRATEQINCCYDHWGGSSNVRLIGCYGRVNDTAANQVVNFNAIRTSSGGGSAELWVSDGFVIMGCDLFGRTTVQRSINLETLGTNLSSAVKNVRIIGNKLTNIRIVMGGQTYGVSIQGNEFLDCTGDSPCVYGRNQNSVGPEDIVVIGNRFSNCDGLGTGGLIETTGPRMLVAGNTASGGVYDYGVRFRVDPGGYILNDFSGAAVSPVLGDYGAAGNIQIANGDIFGMLDTTGNQVKLRVDSGNSLGLVGTAANGSARTIFSATMTSDTSSLNVFLNTTFSGYTRTTFATGLTATGVSLADALVLASQSNVVTTTAAGTGVRLFEVTGGGVSVAVYNDGANTLNVYPVNGSATIQGLGAGIADTIASGVSKTYVSVSANNYRIAA